MHPHKAGTGSRSHAYRVVHFTAAVPVPLDADGAAGFPITGERMRTPVADISVGRHLATGAPHREPDSTSAGNGEHDQVHQQPIVGDVFPSGANPSWDAAGRGKSG